MLECFDCYFLFYLFCFVIPSIFYVEGLRVGGGCGGGKK